MTDGSFVEVYAAIKDAPVGSLNHIELTQAISNSITSLGPEDVTEVVRALASLYRLSLGRHVNPEVLAKEIYQAIWEEGKNLVSQENAPKFREHIAKFLSLESLNLITSKAKELQLDVEKALCEARILTDIRPVFGSDVSSPPGAMVIVHALKLVYHDGPMAEHKEIYIGVDEGDIRALRNMLERAEEKAKTLTKQLKAAGIKAVDLA